jgi:protein-S-isoprenylcysteine O-methyltransferase Ste14
LLFFIGVPLLLGSWWGLLLSLVLIVALAWRAVNEERELREELSGYADYMRRVPYRLVPKVW